MNPWRKENSRRESPSQTSLWLYLRTLYIKHFIYKILIITFDSNYKCDCNKKSFLLKLIIIGRFYSVKKKEKKKIFNPRYMKDKFKV